MLFFSLQFYFNCHSVRLLYSIDVRKTQGQYNEYFV